MAHAVAVVVDDGDDDGENPNQRRPVGGVVVDGQVGGEAGPDDDEGAVEEAEGVDGDAEAAQAPAGGREGLASDAAEEDAAWFFMLVWGLNGRMGVGWQN